MIQTISCGTFGSQQLDLPLRCETRYFGKGAPERLIIGLHGFGDAAAHFIHLAEACPFRKNVLWVCPQAPLAAPTGGDGGQWTPLFDSHIEAAHNAVRLVQDTTHGIGNAFGIPMPHRALLGFSQGAWLALSILLRSRERWGAVVALSGFVNQVHGLKELTAAVLQTPVFIAHGENDQVVWPYQFFEVLDVLRYFKLGNITPRRYPIDHSVSNEELADIAAFLEASLV